MFLFFCKTFRSASVSLLRRINRRDLFSRQSPCYNEILCGSDCLGEYKTALPDLRKQRRYKICHGGQFSARAAVQQFIR